MLKNISQLKSIIEGKEGTFHCDMDTPIHIVKEMLFQFQKYIGKIEDAFIAQQENEKKEEESKEEVKKDDPKIEELQQV